MTDILLSSGGLDSAVIAADRPGAIHLHVRYGQRNWIQERTASQKVAAHYGAERVEAVFTEFAQLATSSLTGAPGGMSGRATVVPNRNAMLISLGVALAISRGGGTVLIGCNANDYFDYPDCRPAFIAAANAVSDLASDARVGVEAPLLHLSKSEIGQLALDRRVPVADTWSCYAPVSQGWGQHGPCRTCGACTERKVALG